MSRLPIPEPFQWDEDGEPTGWIEARDDATGQPCGWSYHETDKARSRRLAEGSAAALARINFTPGMARTLRRAQR